MTTAMQKAIVEELYYRSAAIRQLEAALSDAGPEASAQLQLQIASDRAAIGPIMQAVIAARWPCAAALLQA